ncbi:MAG: response regulator transcription factor [Pseudomonadota bacterium]
MEGTAGTAGRDSILLVDDDEQLVALVSQFLEDNGFETRVVGTGTDAIQEIHDRPPRLVVLDIMLPGADGLQVCRAVRQYYTGPILMLTALSDDIDEVAGLELGADDYLGKPVKPRVLLARIRALLRRSEQDATETEEQRSIIAGQVAIDRNAREVRVNGHGVDLTASEFELLWMLAMNRGHVVSRDALHEEVLRTPFDGLDRTIDLRVSRLRRKLGDDSRCPEMIKTVRGRGYLLADR